MTKFSTNQVTQEVQHWNLRKLSAASFRLAGIVLVATVWISAGLFGLYILAFYAAALFGDNLERWNKVLPGLYSPGSTTATTGIGLHFAAGGIILILGSIQLIRTVRIRYPALHRWIGRIYVVASLLTAVGGLIFIIMKGTIGGVVMNIGFSLYGVLMLIASIQTYRHAAAGRIDKHRAWALRLYALAIGSWLYRMDYGIWFFITKNAGHTPQFDGPFDIIMSFFFYIPNLLIAEAFIRARQYKTSPVLNIFSACILLFMTSFLVVGTYYFTKFYWGPAILEWISGS